MFSLAGNLRKMVWTWAMQTNVESGLPGDFGRELEPISGITWQAGGVTRHLLRGVYREAERKAGVRTDFQSRDYGLNLLVEGVGAFWDGAGERHELRPGTLFARLPGQTVGVAAQQSGTWVEWYFSLDAVTFADLRALGLLSDRALVHPALPPREIARMRQLLQAATASEAVEAWMPEWLRWWRDAASTAEPRERPEPRLDEAARRLRENFHEALDLPELAASLGFGYELFRKRFKERFGESPGRYRIRHRLQMAAAVLQSGLMQVQEVAEALGYSDAFTFSAQFREVFGCSPRAYRRGRESVRREGDGNGAGG